MREEPSAHMRKGPSRRSVRIFLLVLAIGLAGAFVLARQPRPVAAVGTLDQCLGGWPVVVFEGEDWRTGVPDNLRQSAQRRIPVAAWPSGMRFDETEGALLDGRGETVFRKGARVRVAGRFVETPGDPAPCFYTLGIRIDAIAAP